MAKFILNCSNFFLSRGYFLYVLKVRLNGFFFAGVGEHEKCIFLESLSLILNVQLFINLNILEFYVLCIQTLCYTMCDGFEEYCINETTFHS